MLGVGIIFGYQAPHGIFCLRRRYAGPQFHVSLEAIVIPVVHPIFFEYLKIHDPIKPHGRVERHVFDHGAHQIILRVVEPDGLADRGGRA